MICKMIHSADWHMGGRQYGFAQREQDYYDAANQVVDIAIWQKCDALILAGDNFDAAKPPARAVLMLQQIVRRAQDAGVRVLGIDGNHDCCNNHWLSVCGIEALSDKPVVINGCAIVGINATRWGQFEVRLKDMIDRQIRADILVIHQAVQELSDFASDFTASAIAKLVRQLGVTYVAMGDIHGYKETVVDGVRFCYPGSTEMTALDQDRQKSVEVVTCTDGAITTGTIALKTRPFKDYRLNDEADLAQITRDAIAEVKPLLIVSYAASKRELASRAEAVLQSSGLMYRMYPVSEDTDVRVTTAQRTFERRGAIQQLKAAVEDFFDVGSEEAQLVFQLLDSPDTVKPCVHQYLKSKGVEV